LRDPGQWPGSRRKEDAISIRHVIPGLLLLLSVPAASTAEVTFELLDLPTAAPWADFSLSRDGQDMGCVLGGAVYWWSQGDGFLFLAPGSPDGGGVGMAADGRAMIAANRHPQGTEPTIWYRDGGVRGLGTTDSACQTAHPADCGFDLSADGSIAVGQVHDCDVLAGFIWSADAGMRSLRIKTTSESRATAVSANGRVVVGFSEHPETGRLRPALWRDGRGPELFLGEDRVGEALGISLDGNHVVGQADLGGLHAEAFYQASGGDVVALGSLAGRITDSSVARAVSDDGKVVGWCGDVLWGNQRAFIWTASAGMRSLDSILSENGIQVPAQLVLTRALDISGDGSYVVGEARDRQLVRHYWLLYLGDALNQPPRVAGPVQPPSRRTQVLPDSLEQQRAGAFEPFPFGKRQEMPPP